MRTAARDARLLGMVKDIRHLQMRAAEGELVRAEQGRRAAGERLAEGKAAVRAAEQGWAAATAERFLDPTLSRAWLHALERRRAEERTLAEAEATAAEAAEARRAALRIAHARADASKQQARYAARTVARQREEAGLAAVEDRLNARRKIV